jgi:anti-sigma-K factor RskA
MNCSTVDELAAAYALGAVEPEEELAIGKHLIECEDPHHEARALIGAAGSLAATPERPEPSEALRARILVTAASTPQEHAARPARVEVTVSPPPPWWRFDRLAPALAAAGLALAVGLGAWGITLQQQVAERDGVLHAMAAADSVFPVRGEAGSGWLIETDGEALFVAEGLAALPSDLLYELWLIEPDGSPIAVGVITQLDTLNIVALERPLGRATAFAITVEAGRVDAPTTDPVLTAALGT